MLAACAASPVRVGQHPYAFALGDRVINYLLSLPEEYGRNRNQMWPLLIFLHGSGEQGSTVDELSLLEQHGPPKALAAESPLEALASRFIVLSPQCDG